MGSQWVEALELDEARSYLPSPRPLKLSNHRHPSTGTSTDPTPSPSASQPFLQRCCSLPSQSSHAPQTPVPNTAPQQDYSSPIPLIPGPAGTIQAAMLRRKNQVNQNFMNLAEEELIPTQEYIRKAVEDGGGAEDDDFSRNPWLCAVDFIRSEGLVVDGDGAIGIPLSAIKSGLSVGKVAQVAAIVTSCSPNGLGDLMVTLKDPTGTIHASIHHRVLTEGEFGRDISVGAVIIAQKVAVFCPSSCAYYLNITDSNVVKIISKDGQAPLKPSCSASKVKHTAPEWSDKSWMPQKLFPLTQGRTGGNVDGLGQSPDILGKRNDLMEGDMTTQNSSHNGERSKNNQNSITMKDMFIKEEVTHGAEVAAEATDNHEEVVMRERLNPWDQVGEGSMLEAAKARDLVHTPNNQENDNNSGIKSGQQPTSRASLPQWTDEQLDELFAFD